VTRIACLGWGSLIWDPQGLPIRRHWFEDGPFAPVEFSRKSKDGLITLVLDPDAAQVRLLWSLFDTSDVHAAGAALGAREGVGTENLEGSIGKWQSREKPPQLIPDLGDWAAARGIDAVVWTSLPPKFDGTTGRPGPEAIVEYLTSLLGSKRDHAERYIRNAPRQIDTEYRRLIEAHLGWIPLP